MGEEKLAFGKISIKIWRAMLRIGHTLDLNEGGFYDSRSGAINVWASPEDKPEGWDCVKITQGALYYPRSYVGEVLGDLINGEVSLYIIVTPYDRYETEGMERSGGEPTQAEIDWISGKIRKLVDMATNDPALNRPEGIYCRFCDQTIQVVLVNEFMDHLIEKHNVQITSVDIGEGIVLNTNVGAMVV